jgi:hypothetical protein
MTTTTEITVRFAFEGWHNWPEAPEHRAYLRSEHRHLFHVEVAVSVEHHDREVEFHDLLDLCKKDCPGPSLGRHSCEDIAQQFIALVSATYPGRAYRVSVWEDNEVGATVSVTPS